MTKHLLDLDISDDVVLQKLLFCRGYLITTRSYELDGYPFFGNWSKEKIGDYYYYVHREQKKYVYTTKTNTIVMIGHAYEPISQEVYEDNIIKKLLKKYKLSKKEFNEYLSKITGNYIIIIHDGDKTIAYNDPCGMEPMYYGKIQEDTYFSSYAQLIADLCDLKMDRQVLKYINAKFYQIGIRQLTGHASAFKELKMLIPNNYLELETQKMVRYYPVAKLSENPDLNKIATILKNSIECCIKKWDCSISLTAGVDSKMTLAAATANSGNQFKSFSFISSKAEEKDAIAAHRICDALGITHQIYDIPPREEITTYDKISKIVDHNTSHILKLADNDKRKISYLYENANITMEIKSHVSEVGRAFYYKKLGKNKFNKKLSCRQMSNLAKRNFFNRSILKNMDKLFNDFVKNAHFGNFPKGYDETDMFYWENRMPMWGAIVKQSFNVSHDTTIIYNNRYLLESFLQFDLKNRIADVPQKQITKLLNSKIDELNIHNENAMEGKKRKFIERVFFEINSRIPF